MDRIKIFLTTAVLTMALLGLAGTARAASPKVTWLVPAGTLRAGDTVSVDLHLDSGGQLMNSFNLLVRYSPVHLEPVSIVREQRIWTLWPEEPRWDGASGAISLTAGRPNGLVAIDAPVATVTFRILSGGQTQLALDRAVSGMYLNDGRGTRVDLTAAPAELYLADSLVTTMSLDSATTPAPDVWSPRRDLHIVWPADPSLHYSYALSADSQTLPDDSPDQPVGSVEYPDRPDGVWYWTVKSRTDDGLWSRVSQHRFLLDTQPPRPFTVVTIDPKAIGGRRAVAWNAVDDTSGVVSSTVMIDGRAVGPATSPFLIKPQWSGATLTVIVRDQAGNEQRAGLRISGSRMTPLWAVIGGLIIAILLTIRWRPRRR